MHSKFKAFKVNFLKQLSLQKISKFQIPSFKTQGDFKVFKINQNSRKRFPQSLDNAI